MLEKIFVILPFIFHFSVIAQTALSGTVNGKTFTASGNPHIVTDDLIIEKGASIAIKEGAVFLFKPFTGIQVSGTLVVAGTKEKPVIFTSVADSLFNPAAEQKPNPFDWNGIFVTRESGTVSLKHFSLRFSVYGIKSQNTDIIIDNGLFSQNGQFHVTLNDKIQFVQDNIPFSYNSGGVPDAPRRKGAAAKRSVFVKKGVPAIVGGTGVACGAVSLVFLSKWMDQRNKYREASDRDKARELRDDGKLPSQIAINTGAVSMVAISAGAVLYCWWNKQEKKPVAITPIILPGCTGAAVTVTLRR